MSFLRDYLHIFSVGTPIQKEEALPITRGDILHFGVKLAASALIAYVSVRVMVRYLDPTYAGELFWVSTACCILVYDAFLKRRRRPGKLWLK